MKRDFFIGQWFKVMIKEVTSWFFKPLYTEKMIKNIILAKTVYRLVVTDTIPI
jgi:hypothetical protein